MKTTNEILDKVREVCKLKKPKENYTYWQPEVHLEHLLKAVHKKYDGGVFVYVTSNGFFQTNGYKKNPSCSYDLTKSVEWNLDNNPELSELVANLIF